MKIKKISRDKVIVYLSDQELEYFDFNPGVKMPQSGDLHKFLFDVMEVVQTETGFDPYHGGQVVVEAAPMGEGMSLTISKIGIKKKPITRDEFKKVKKVRVKSSDAVQSEKLTRREIEQLIRMFGADINVKPHRAQNDKTVFVFAGFGDMEQAICLVPEQVLAAAVLYRHKGRYALVTELKRGEKSYNLLSEFSELHSCSSVTVHDICEGWEMVAGSDALVNMAQAVRSMQ